ncbi:hypothetical protein, partial [Actinophytocola sediminis]
MATVDYPLWANILWAVGTGIVGVLLVAIPYALVELGLRADEREYQAQRLRSASIAPGEPAVRGGV